jgi:hypothetical protein
MMIFKMKRILLNIVILSLAITSFAQNLSILDPISLRNYEKESLLNNKIHSSIKSYYYSDLQDSLYFKLDKEKSVFLYFWESKPKRKKLNFYASPNFEILGLFSPSQQANNYGINSNLGGLLEFTIDSKLGISYNLNAWYLSETPSYVFKDYANSRIYYNLGRSILQNRNILFENNLRITYSPYDFFRLELGNGKNFYGDGYRSFLLSDFASNYPYLKLETSFLSIKYSSIWAVHQDMGSIIPETGHLKTENKFDVFHFLDWKIGNYVNLGLFEAIISSKQKFFSLEYFNPIIFFRPVEFSLGSEDNALLGINLKVKINKNNFIYSQFVIDDIIVTQLINDIKHNINPNYSGEYGWFANKWAAQIGFKSYDIFKLKNLDFFTEINIARPYIYSHVHTNQNYSHLWQALAHPLGGNFIESVTGLRFYGEKFIIDTKFMYAKIGRDGINTHFGSNIFQATMDGVQGYPYIVNSYGNTILQGISTNNISFIVDFAYSLLKNKNLFANISLIYRAVDYNLDSSKNEFYICFGIKSNLYNKKSLLY